MPVRIVDPFEIIYIQHQQTQRAAVPLDSFDFNRDSFLERPPIGQAGQFIHQGNSLDGLIGIFQLGRQPADHEIHDSHEKKDSDQAHGHDNISAELQAFSDVGDVLRDTDAAPDIAQGISLFRMAVQAARFDEQGGHVLEIRPAVNGLLAAEFRGSFFKRSQRHRFEIDRPVSRIQWFQAGNMEGEAFLLFGVFRYFPGHQGRVFLGVHVAAGGGDVRVFQIGIGFDPFGFLDENAVVSRVPAPWSGRCFENESGPGSGSGCEPAGWCG